MVGQEFATIPSKASSTAARAAISRVASERSAADDNQAARSLQMVRERRLMLDDLEADLALVGVLTIEGGDAAQIGGEFAQHLGERQAPARDVGAARQRQPMGT